MDRFVIMLGDITQQKVDAIVNAANNSLSGGGGVDGAIHAAAGPQLLAECKLIGGCYTGQAKHSQGYNLPVKWIIHTVGPVWSGGTNQEDELLASSYQNVLTLAVDLGVKTIAFPSISTGAFGFPVDRAARIAVKEIETFLQKDRSIEKIFMVTFDADTYRAYKEAVGEV